MFYKSLIGRVIILNILLLTFVIGAFTLFHLRREQKHLVSATRESAELLLNTIENSIFNSMRVGNSESVQRVLEMVGRSERLTNVRIFHPDGTILKSAQRQEIGRLLNSYDYVLFQNGRADGIFRAGGQDVLGILKPIVSDERCFLCHGEGRKIIGVLNLNFSLADTSQKLQKSYVSFMFSTGFIIVLLSSGVSFILLGFVKRPLQNLSEKMAQVEEGDLSVRLVPLYTDEVGSLMRSFNSMVVNLERAKQELQQCHYQQMERADRLASVGELATGLAHEIKNPLAGISGAISVIADDFDEADPRKEIVRQVLEQIKRLDKTATDLLHFGRPGKPEFAFADLNALVEKTLFFVSQHPEARNIRQRKELAEDLPPIWVDAKQIQQVLLNIIINAVQAMNDGGTLTLRTERSSRDGMEWVSVAIGDSGKGIEPEELEKIFVPFHTTKNQGTGLGLPICRQLLEQHNGTIGVESRPGQGTTFIIELPVSEGRPLPGNEDDSAQT